MSELAVVERTEVAPASEPQRALRPARSASTPMMSLLSRAVENGQPIEVIRELMAMSKEIAEDEARKAFITARSAAKAEIPVIIKNRHVGFDSKRGGASTDYWHEDLAEIARTIDPILGRHGLSYEFVPMQAGNILTITCVLSHEGGYSKEYPLSAANDTSGNKNSIQGVGSTATFLSRYTLKMALGLAASKDDDGATSEQTVAESTTLSERQVMDLTDLLDETAAGRKDHKKAFLAYMKVESLSEIPAKDYQRAVDAVNSTRVRA